ncbi:MAG: SUMF1/EgtB/PvdO family nonheme iron enzyme [Anaerolineae bacterium]|nr:SUMF1/EgtB/PvdO family nonheme iron enzyme [Anaerolineae bacterium]
MFRLLSVIVGWLQNLFSITPPGSPPENEGDSQRPRVQVVRRLAKKAQTSLQEEVPRWGRFTTSLLQDRWHWASTHLWTIAGAVVLIGLIFVSERAAIPWWLNVIEKVKIWWVQVWQAYPVSITLAGIALLLFLFGLDWLRQLDNWLLRLWQWANAHRQISTTLAVILLLLIFYILSNTNTWAFTSVEVWSEDALAVTGQEIVVQFRGNLSAIGTSSFEALTLSTPNLPAAVTNAKGTLNRLSLADCGQVMLGPKSFAPLGGRSPVALPRLDRAKADIGTAGQISLGTTLGTFDLPLTGLLRFIFGFAIPDYRELSAQIVPASRISEAGGVRIIVTDLEGNRWMVEGAPENLPQLINFLAYRIALDWQADRTGQASDVDSANLALTLGNQAYAAGNYTVALAYYRLAEWFRPDVATVEVMLGLTQLQLSQTTASAETASMLRDKAVRAFNQAAVLEQNNTDLYPYLACLYQELGDGQQAAEKLEAFNDTLRPDSPDAKQQRITELSKKQLRGPGRLLSTFYRPAEAGFDLYYISENAAWSVPALPKVPSVDTLNELKKPMIAGEAPRQVFAVAGGAYYLTTDGLVSFYQPNRPTLAVMDAESLQLKRLPSGEFLLGASPDEADLNTGGISQIFADGELLFLVDRFGRILRLRVVQTGTGGLEVKVEAMAEVEARQIFLDTNALYVLKEDGTIWRISDPRAGDLQTARQLVSDTDNQEITAANGVVYMRRDNGNIWRYLDGEGSEGDLLKRIDPGINTNHIFIADPGLFVLKNDGSIWLIRNPQNPGKNDFEQLNLPMTNRMAMNVTGPNLIALEREETKGPEPKFYLIPESSTSAASQVVQAPLPPSPTSIPTSTPTPSPPPPTPTTPPTPTATSRPTATPTPTAMPTLEIEAEIAAVVTQTRTIDNAAEILVATAANQANWFWIDRTEVTNRQYQACVEAEVCTINADGYAALFYLPDHPVVGVNWSQAQAYCEWVAGSLPTVSQWRAAASPNGRIYPWGDTGPSCQVAVINDACDTAEPGTRPVGSKPNGAGSLGVLDLIGNVWEWTATLGNKNDARILLGGSWSNPDGTAQGGLEAFNPANTLSQGETHRENNVGFRCVRPYTPASSK